MSVSNHNAPIQTLNNSKSNRSLYTQNSQQSQLDTITRQQQNNMHLNNINGNEVQSPRRQELISSKINKLPQIFPMHYNSGNKNKEKQQEKNIIKNKNYDQMPFLPTKGTGIRYGESDRKKQNQSNSNSKSHHIGSIGGPQFNTIAVTSLDRNQMRNIYGQPNNQMRMTGMSGFSGINQNQHQIQQNQRSRMLRSSQGGRWFRSQSLMQDKSKQLKNQTNIEMLIRNFHRHQSKYTEQLNQYIAFYSMTQKQFLQKNNIFHKYRINISDSVQEIKNKMQVYLQSKIDLSNLPIDRPDSDWGQQQLMKFYTNYHQILNQRFQLNINNNSNKNQHGMKQQNEQNKQEDNQSQKIVTILKKYKNCTYYGPVKDGKKHGFGYLHYFSGRFYEGLFANDQKIKGFQMDDNELYYGQYDKNQRHGQGILKTNQYLLSGIFIGGEFKIQNLDKNNQSNMNKNAQRLHKNLSNQNKSNINRKGFKIQFSNVTFYMGNPTIIQKNNNGDIFIGQFNQQNQKNGEGLQIFANGDLYIGCYQQGAPEGYGEYYWDSGAFYRGQFISGMRHGKGIWMMVQGDRYEGDYLNDKKNGKGVYTWKSGDRYIGQFENDYRHGYGEMYWRDGTNYKGQWLNGIQSNKTFKIQNNQLQNNQPQHHPPPIQPHNSTKNTFKTVQTRTRVLKKQPINSNNKSVSRNSQNKNYHTIQQTSSQPAKSPYIYEVNNKRIPLQKLKAMLNPSNSIN